MGEEMTLPTLAVRDEDSEGEEEGEQGNSASSLVWGRLIPLQKDFPSIDLQDDEITLGRSEKHFSLPGRKISSAHCKITKVVNPQDPDPVIFIEDLSTNGTFVDGQKVGNKRRKVLTHGCEIALGAAPTSVHEKHFIFHLAGSKTRQKEEENIPEVFQKYDIGNILGKGNFSVVKLGISKETGKRYAVKIIDKKKILMQPVLAEAFRREVEILKQVKHPGVIAFNDYHEDETNIYIFLDLVTGGELAAKIFTTTRPSESTIKFYCYQLIQAVKYLHKNNTTHRDLKPENVLLQSVGSDRVLVTDFGLSKVVNQSSLMQTVCGTPIYLAPEILIQLDSNPESAGYGKAVDMWSLGVILYVMCVGYPPFQGDTREKLFHSIKTGKLDFGKKEWWIYPPQVKDLIAKLLDHNSATRYDVDKTLLHPWLQDQSTVARYNELYSNIMMPPPTLKTGITSTFQQKVSIIPEANNFQKPTLQNVPTPKRQLSGRTDTDSDSDQIVTDTSETLYHDKKGNDMDVDADDSSGRSGTNSPVNAGSSSWGTLLFTVDNPSCCNIPLALPLVLTKSTYIVGRGEGCDIIFADNSISKQHCKLFFKNGEAFVEDMSSNGTHLGLEKLQRGVPTRIEDGSEITLLQRDVTNAKPTQRISLMFETIVIENRKRKRADTAGNGDKPRSPQKKQHLEENGQQKGKEKEKEKPKKVWGQLLPLSQAHPRVDLIEGSYTLGKGRECTIALNEETLSPQHCRIFVQNGVRCLQVLSDKGVWVEDDKQKQGTVIQLEDMAEVVLVRKPNVGFVFRAMK